MGLFFISGFKINQKNPKIAISGAMIARFLKNFKQILNYCQSRAARFLFFKVFY